MKLKHLVIFGAVFAVLVVAVILQKIRKPAELVTEEYTALNYAFDASKVARIEIGKGKAPKLIELKRSPAGDWTLPTFFEARADQKKIEDLMKVFQSVKGELRGKDKALWDDFGLTEDIAYRLAFFDAANKPVFEVFLGPKIPRYGVAFTRKSGSELVYLTDGELFGKLGMYDDPEKTLPENKYWARLILAEPKTDLIDEVLVKRFEGGKETVAAHVRRETDPADLSRKKWKFENPQTPFAVDAEKIKQYLKSFETRPASQALDPKARDYGFANPKWQMQLRQEGGEEILLTAVADGEQNYFVQVSGAPVVFQYPKYYFENLDIDDSKFFVADPLLAGTGVIEKVTVHTPSGEAAFSPKEDKRDAVKKFTDHLKGLTVAKLAPEGDAKIDPRSDQGHWIEIKKEGVPEALFLDVGGVPYQDGKDYLAQKRDGTKAFLISEATFKNLFGNVDALKPLSGAKDPAV